MVASEAARKGWETGAVRGGARSSITALTGIPACGSLYRGKDCESSCTAMGYSFAVPCVVVVGTIRGGTGRLPPPLTVVVVCARFPAVPTRLPSPSPAESDNDAKEAEAGAGKEGSDGDWDNSKEGMLKCDSFAAAAEVAAPAGVVTPRVARGLVVCGGFPSRSLFVVVAARRTVVGLAGAVVLLGPPAGSSVEGRQKEVDALVSPLPSSVWALWRFWLHAALDFFPA